jgi:hypothetical protein
MNKTSRRQLIAGAAGATGAALLAKQYDLIPPDAGTPPADAGTETSLYERLGGNAGIAGAVDAIVAAELMDPEIAAYFTFAAEFPGAITATQI